jgi:hypothetical protein
MVEADFTATDPRAAARRKNGSIGTAFLSGEPRT